MPVNKKEKLFQDFPAISTNEWEQKIKEDLKGADYSKKLIWNSPDGITVKSYYRQEHLAGIKNMDLIQSLVSQKSEIGENKSWLIRQSVKVEDSSKANIIALDALNKGANSICYHISDSISFNELLKEICCEAIEINYSAGEHIIDITKRYVEFLDKEYSNPDKIRGSLRYNPLGNYNTKGKFYFNSEESSINKGVELFTLTSRYPNLRIINVQGNNYHNAGASTVEELAFSLAEGNAYIEKLIETGLDIDQIANKVEFTFSIGSDYFFEIAKLRAARLLWKSIIEAYKQKDVDNTTMFIYCETSRWNKTIYDPYVNMLRTTTEAMSAIIGGTDSLTVEAFNSIYENSTGFSERIARNQQIILKEEAYLDKVTDPSAGSYYIESLTNDIAEQAWKLFLEIMNNGGYIESFKKGIIQDRIENTSRNRDMAVALRKEVLVGTNQYPNFSESISTDTIESKANNKNGIKHLKLYRGAFEFEKVRLKTDIYSKKSRQPIVFLVKYGNLGMRGARAQFASNFFACAGFKIIDNNGFNSVKEGMESAQKSSADIIVFCSSDEEYDKISPQELSLKGEKVIPVIAGYPKDKIEKLKEIGMSHFIHIKSNVLESLKEFQKLLGI